MPLGKPRSFAQKRKAAVKHFQGIKSAWEKKGKYKGIENLGLIRAHTSSIGVALLFPEMLRTVNISLPEEKKKELLKLFIKMSGLQTRIVTKHGTEMADDEALEIIRGVDPLATNYLETRDKILRIITPEQRVQLNSAFLRIMAKIMPRT